ncbi:MAG TPA: methylmalonyl Co-A mutase-associated GTPase MeaB [Polyangiaceae bacterium]|nr:methylmalonyl Co-A mutase-associated GTPase MeaB [Polyangiaceae bacterium]
MLDDLVSGVLRGEERAVARACRLIDDREPRVAHLIDELHGATKQPQVIGVTGSPGSGKSSLVSGMVTQFRALGKRVGVLAIDPSSPFTGGAILGDRVRMQRHFGDPGVFIRSLATRGAQGGLSRSVQEHVVVLDAAGYDIIVIETVGVGQDELDVAEVAASTIVVTQPGTGDDIQAVKSGILEIADVFVVNKADRDGADRAVFELEQRLELARTVGAASAASHAWQAPVLKCVALTDSGLPELVQALAAHGAWLALPEGAKRAAARRQASAERLIFSLVCEQLARVLEVELKRAAVRLVERNVSPHAAAAELLARVGADTVSES